MWHKLFMGVINMFVSSKFADKLVYISQIAELEQYVSVSQLYVPEPAKSYDQKYYPSLSRPVSVVSGATQIGVPLKALMKDGHIPKIMDETAANIRANGLRVTGIFRRSPSQATLQEVIAQYNRGESVDLSQHDIHLSAVLLKKFLRDLPEGLIPASLKHHVENVNFNSIYQPLLFL